jgi:hypothetical protein
MKGATVPRFTRAAVTAVVCWFAGLAGAAEPLAGPAEFKRDTIGVFKAETKGKLLITPPAGLDVKKSADGGTWYVAGKPGTYRLSGHYFTVDFEAKTWDVQVVDVGFTITGGDPVPPAPAPAPAPADPTDPLFPQIKAAFAGQSVADAKALAAVYRLAAKDGGVVDTSTTAQGLLTVTHAAAEQVCKLPKLQAVRELIAGELDHMIGTKDAQLNGDSRTLIKGQFNRMATLLEALK